LAWAKRRVTPTSTRKRLEGKPEATSLTFIPPKRTPTRKRRHEMRPVIRVKRLRRMATAKATIEEVRRSRGNLTAGPGRAQSAPLTS
jgi:hypothetical protein